MSDAPATTPIIEVFYDEDCPICRWEVRLYERMDQRHNILWTEIGGLTPQDLPSGKTREDLLGRFHVRELPQSHVRHLNTITSETWFMGVDAFGRIWQALPRLKLFSGLFRIPVIRQATMLAYRLFLMWQKWHRSRRTAKQT